MKLKPYISFTTLAFSLALLCSGCLAPKSYVDPQFRDATYQSIKSSGSPRLVVVDVEFQVNGKHGNQQQDVLVRRKVVRVLNTARVFAEASSTNAAEAGRLQVTVNDMGDIGAAAGKGFATGLTFGLVGSHVVDSYEMTVTYTPPSGLPITKKYRHAIHTTIGAHSTPKGMEPVPIADAFDQVVEDMLLNFLRDLQKEARILEKTSGQVIAAHDLAAIQDGQEL